MLFVCTLSVMLFDMHDFSEATQVSRKDVIEFLEHLTPSKEVIKAFQDQGGLSNGALHHYLAFCSDEVYRNYSPFMMRLFATVRHIQGDRTEFRKIALASLSQKNGMSSESLVLLKDIGTEEDAPVVAEYILKNPKGYADLYYAVKTLAVIGTEKEIEVLDRAREARILHDDGDFWQLVAKSKIAIQDRADAKKKLKAKLPDR